MSADAEDPHAPLSQDGPDQATTQPETLAVEADAAEAGGVTVPVARRRSPGRRALSALRELAVIVVSALALSLLIKTFLVQAFFIPSSSMEDTLQVDDRVLVSKLAPALFEVHRGDVVVFKDPGGWLPPTREKRTDGPGRFMTNLLTFTGLLPADAGEHLIKRVIGVGGDTVSCCDDEGRLSVNGVPLEEPYLKSGSVPSEVPFTAVVPDGYVWVMGDNRQDSADSRFHTGEPGGGAVPLRNVVGIAQVRMWPLDRFTIMRNPGAVFSEVEGPGSERAVPENGS